MFCYCPNTRLASAHRNLEKTARSIRLVTTTTILPLSGSMVNIEAEVPPSRVQIVRIGVRMALGATRANILRLIANDGLRMVLVGLAVGLGTALAVSRMLKTVLFQVSVYDPLTYIVVPLLLSLVALIAIVIPARAGTHVEPAVTLRAE